MSLITRCPACETLFKVVPDQLRISEGWVRCGQCEEIFDASNHLLPPAGEPLAPPVAGQGNQPAEAAHADFANETPAALDVPEISHAAVSAPQPLADDVPEHVEFQPTEVQEVPLFPAPVAADVVAANTVNTGYDDDQADDRDDDDSAWNPQSEAPPLDMPEDEWVQPDDDGVKSEVPLSRELEEIVARRSQHVPLGGLSTTQEVEEEGKLKPSRVVKEDDDSEPESLPDSVEPSFMLGAGGHSVWRKPLVRWGMGAAALMLLAGLCLQVMVQERDRMVAREPATRPWLMSACAVLNCAISPLRQIESIVIESSSFAKIRGDAYRLNFVIKNAATMPLAMPAVELALTDPQNKAVIRRIFLPAEYGALPDALAAGAEWAGSLAIGVKPGGETDRIAGYRVLAFYP